jgi:hypothetical protein
MGNGDSPGHWNKPYFLKYPVDTSQLVYVELGISSLGTTLSRKTRNGQRHCLQGKESWMIEQPTPKMSSPGMGVLFTSAWSYYSSVSCLIQIQCKKKNLWD